MTPGDKIASKYRLVRRLGDGSMGEVWAAVNERTEGEVALKLIVSPNAELRERLVREARACGRLRHRNIVEVHDVGETGDGEPFLVMQLLHGETLGERIERGPIPLRQAAAIAIDVARALRAAHAAGIVHRDLKPANVFLHREADVEGETVKVLDFGVSKLLATEGAATATVTGTLVGSPAYMSPEQARATKGIDHRTDLWSLGVVLFEMITGERPFPHKAMLGVIAEILSAPIPVPSERVPALPEGVDAVVARCLERDASRRVASAEALIEMLRPFAEGEAPRVASLPEPPSSPRLAASALAVADTEHATVPLHAGAEASVDEQMPTAIFERARMQQQEARVDETALLPDGGTRPLTAEDVARAGAFASLRRPAIDRAVENEITEDLDDQRRTAPMGKPSATALLATMPLPVPGAPKAPAEPPVPAVTSTTGALVQSPAAVIDRPAGPSAADIANGKRRGLALVAASVLTVVMLILLGLTIGRSLSGGEDAATAAASGSAVPVAASDAPSAPVVPVTPTASATAAVPDPADTSAPDVPAPPASGAASADAPPRAVGGHRPATLNIVSTPASRVLLDDKPLGTTPRNGIIVTPGTHIVTFQHTLLGKKIMVIQIKAGETKTASVEFGKR